MKKLSKTPKIKTIKEGEKKKIHYSKQTSLKLPQIATSFGKDPPGKPKVSLNVAQHKKTSFVSFATSAKSIVLENLEKNKDFKEKLDKSKQICFPGCYLLDFPSMQLHTEANMRSLLELLSNLEENTYSLDLQIQKNSLDDRDILRIMQSLESLINLNSLTVNLEQNYIGGGGLFCFAKKLSHFKFLKKISLNLSWVGIKDSGLLKLGNALNGLLYLEDLEIMFDWNSPEFDSMIDFFISLKNLGSMKYLKVSLIHTGFNDHLCMALREVLKNAEGLFLLKLNLKWNEITDEGFLSLLPVIFEKISKLRKLHLNFDNNKITDVGLLSLSHLIQNIAHLQDFELKLYDNLIDLSYQMFIEEILKKKSLFSAVFHLGKCIFNDKQIIIAKVNYNEILLKFHQWLQYKQIRRKQLMNMIFSLQKSRQLKKAFRKEIIYEISEFF